MFKRFVVSVLCVLAMVCGSLPAWAEAGAYDHSVTVTAADAVTAATVHIPNAVTIGMTIFAALMALAILLKVVRRFVGR